MSALHVRHFDRPPRATRQWSAAAMAMIALVGAALLLRLTIRDRLPGLATLYYAVPLPVAVAVAAVASAIWFALRRRWLGGGALGLALLCLAWMVVDASLRRIIKRIPVAEDQPALRVLLWNVSSGAFGLEHIETMVRESRADVAAFVEARQPGEWMENWWRKTFPAHRYHGFGNGMVVLSRFPISDARFEPFGDLGRCGSLRVDFGGREPLTVALIDIQHYVFSSRAGALHGLDDWVTAHRGEPMLVLGDFNTPPDSVHFEPLRGKLTNAWALAAPHRYSPTWPSILPVLALDQIWVSSRVEVRTIEKRATIVSDHLPLVAEIAVE
ncbi:MAG: endonuclease/exonuclease/phosphatase family protein [Phycisphaerae bacterium]|nr:endonuclease/exonuclease/phosphatase family protein [Phycisphaerae bacterium]